jgi:serine/threonine protein kinase/DNA-directed RNA polymerase subunit RPC12/RpoP
MRALTDILAFTHRLQPTPVVHRDLKPANILLQPTPNGPVPRVTDFGIGGVAAPAAVSISVRAALTGSVAEAHTPIYSSPEQRRGSKADPRDDVYALGVIWYHMLTGHLSREPGSGCRTTLEKKKIPEPVIQLILNCLKRADKRWANAGILAEELARSYPPPKVKGDDAGTQDIFGSDFDIALDDSELAADEESGSKVVALDEEEIEPVLDEDEVEIDTEEDGEFGDLEVEGDAETVLSCSHCQGYRRYDSKYAKQTVACPHCGNHLIMPKL